MENITTVGRRKEAVARVFLSPGKGQITVNGKAITEYFPGSLLQKLYNKPVDITKTSGKFAMTVKVAGGGQISQLDAVVHGIARAIAKTDPAARTALKKEGLLTRDARVKERRKYGNAQKARAKKQSPKR
ncbi:30S ribosomal protein S9 [Candidatus Daviesbacteria bacterium RIFCSPLOWO2_02_FULL_41_8]|uniref:30S ribosomal protein S9 n=3 Tax=Candidatus Daviesiibacteriota TaxID=1752718 RepID=A0A1F5NLZ4_9BACT|nr:MAG: 30S ribosomal protein S9 [Candidatus Daviesbacteria bacterium RIFCSPHIGHO2_01_FULL_41_23]OGE32808.1 MAG: 30S ribosomal protein S9 [Candidatus Daviesbacteria bacterium RIFCSPHIGHO2_02_FULL_41_10]OGE62154.1 MAG: 30S ribosomal protein S9 [Candidatus Daviesbacteria bacterium RIFCSPLOWO2_01_FULL_41_32]OGE78534.1 MAG: 30S ribosomal protein S9 [Candidatus Daviesbacteria bacterium RIFCSPLOWO2_02_FULL_41_8]